MINRDGIIETDIVKTFETVQEQFLNYFHLPRQSFEEVRIYFCYENKFYLKHKILAYKSSFTSKIVQLSNNNAFFYSNDYKYLLAIDKEPSLPISEAFIFAVKNQVEDIKELKPPEDDNDSKRGVVCVLS